MPEARVKLYNCLPVIVDITGGKDADTSDGPGEYWTEITNIWWMKRDDSKGKELSEKLFKEAIDIDGYNLEEAAWEYLRQQKYEALAEYDLTNVLK